MARRRPWANLLEHKEVVTMHPFGSYLASKPVLDGLSRDRQAEVEAMYRRPDCAPLPPLAQRPSLVRRLRDALPPLRRRHPGHV